MIPFCRKMGIKTRLCLKKRPIGWSSTQSSKNFGITTPKIRKVFFFGKKRLATHFGFGNNKNNYATEANIHYKGKEVDRKDTFKVDKHKMLTAQFDFGMPDLDNKTDFYKTTYGKEVSDKDQYNGIIGQPVTLLSQKNASQILFGTKDGELESNYQNK
jgi:hypothetical protein